MFSFLLPYIGAFILGVTSGSFITNEINSSEIAEMRLEILKQREQATKILLAEVAKTSKQYEKAQTLSSTLDKANEQSIQTINTLDSKLKSLRLRDGTSRKSCSSTERENSNTRSSEEETSSFEFPGRLHEFLIARAYDSAIIDNYAKACYTFVVENNCGISKE